MLGFRKKRSEKHGITYFGLLAHEVALLKSIMQNVPELVADYDLREPSQAGSCSIVLVNKDKKFANSWWKNHQKRHPSATPLFLTDSKQDDDQSTVCKRPFTPSVIQAAFKRLHSENHPAS